MNSLKHVLSPTAFTINARDYLIYDPERSTIVLQLHSADNVQVSVGPAQIASDLSEERLFDNAILEMTRLLSNITQGDREKIKSEIEKIKFFDLSDKSEEELHEYIRCQENWWKNIKYKYFYYGPVHLAARFGDLDLMKNIMAETLPCRSLYQGKIYSTVVFSETELESAIRSDNVDLVIYLIQHRGYFSGDNEGDSLIFLILVHAFRFKSNKIIKASLNKYDVNHVSPIYGSLINSAVYNGDLDFIQQLLDLGAYINSLIIYPERFRWFYGALTPLQTAIALKKADIVKLLIRNGANVDDLKPGLNYQMTTLRYAMNMNASRDIIAALLDAGADVFCFCGDYVLPFYYEHRSKLFTKLLKEMAVKLDTVGFNLAKTNKIKRILKDKKLDRFKWECFEEVKRMDKTQIETTNITYYELLTRDVYELAIDDQYAVLQSAVFNKDLEGQFPLYAGIIQARFKNVVKTKKNLPKYEDFILNLFPDASIDLIDELLPVVCEEDLEKEFNSRVHLAIRLQQIVNSMNF
ncbi:GSCOCG00000844001-RA-CDS [Cotesia congregata]|uniref:Uncharacterized protein n=1 Tax=Cotesia congregata TaxID=51543 RepID=A0A8J2HFT2_COTCN|nr:GSCOCG00000844001-RA-CDS [Cotesia congregata]CAG5095611.1 Protein of unknown function [Cotesia congregata]